MLHTGRKYRRNVENLSCYKGTGVCEIEIIHIVLFWRVRKYAIRLSPPDPTFPYDRERGEIWGERYGVMEREKFVISKQPSRKQ